MDSFLMVGQSNMAGRGRIGEVEELNADRLFVYRMGRFRRLFVPVNPDRPSAGVCLAESFAYAYAEAYQTEVGLIPCAQGDSAIREWMPGEMLFEQAVQTARTAMRISDCKGILWHQGEADCKPDRVDGYLQRLVFTLDEMRKAIGRPELPILLGELGYYLPDRNDLYRQFTARINADIAKAAKALSNAALVSAEGLTPNEDCLHFNSVSLRTFGERYFAAYQKIR